MSDNTPIIDARGIDKFYDAHQALRNVSLTVGAGEFVALVGPSGCGKTSLLKILAGFEEASAGTLAIDGRSMIGVPSSQRPTRMVFQKLALFPHKTVGDNIAFPLKLARTDRAETDRRVREIMGLMHLSEAYRDRYPAQLSGGEQQRVALARSMISNPSVLLLDEPLSALDVKLKKSLQAEIKRLHRSVGTSFVHVTHDLEEAMMLADRICVMRAGRILQIGTPSDIYYRPSDTFVAGFIGETNLIAVDLERRGSAHAFANGAIRCAAPEIAARQIADGLSPGRAVLMIRPEMIALEGAEQEPGECTMEGTVDEFFIKGASIQYRVAVDGIADPVIAEVQGTATPPADVGERVRLGFALADVFILATE
ncbi:ABC transporter ATP-binding protein [Kaustia mangrovi]|uniref:ABC transporter ATP-binding protein n=1 Tax=Kaustia mangrovi TaxID=2593653 RepID=A0A7S8HBT5_9HYPH|nr:ABC transporter ATP-binding protein [Kaustia mangrovi]QPC42915.1 ABC transporter ATP-binding protein [Kaustia mangrovi]